MRRTVNRSPRNSAPISAKCSAVGTDRERAPQHRLYTVLAQVGEQPLAVAADAQGELHHAVTEKKPERIADGRAG